MYSLIKTFAFDSAHHLAGCVDDMSPCAAIHGHRWTVRICIKSKTLYGDMVIDFNHIKPIIKKITDRWDHTMINDNPKLANPDGTKIHPTAENMARVLYAEFNAELGMAKLFKGPTMCLAWVEVEETPGAIIRYTPEHV